MQCPICDSSTILKKEGREVNFKNKIYLINESFYYCKKCHESFTDTETDEMNISQVYNQYRQENGLIYPQEIVEIREQYGLSKRKMSLVLGWGENTYSLYEKGAIPNESHSNILKLIDEPTQFLKLIKSKKDQLFTEKEYNNIVKQINKITENQNDFDFTYSISGTKVDEFSGYVKPNYEKLANMVILLINLGNNFLVRLNKLLFYSDFYFYNLNKKPISGFNYAAIDNGPVVDYYKFVFDLLESDEYIKTTEGYFNKRNGEAVEMLLTEKSVINEILNTKEIETINFIYNNFKNISTRDLIAHSQKERGWKDNILSKSCISYQKYADEIQL